MPVKQKEPEQNKKEYFITKKELTKHKELSEKEILSDKDQELLNSLEINKIKEDLINIFLSFGDPYSAKRDDVRQILNERDISFTYIINAMKVKTFAELKDKIISEADIPQKEESLYIDRTYFEQAKHIKDDSLLDYKRGYFVTSIIGGMDLNDKAFTTVLNYCKVKGYELVLLPMKNAYKNRVDREDRDISDYPEAIHPYMDTSFYVEYIFNENIRAKDFLLLPQQKKPLTGLREYGKKQFSLVVASPKQDMETIPVAKGKHPHIIHSTGSLSLPSGYFNDRAGRIAEEDHINGGLIIEVSDSKLFFLRQVQFDQDGGFNDLDSYYIGNKIKKAECVAVTWSDLHNKMECEKALQATYEWTSLIKPSQIYLQDSVDMHSVNPHHLKSTYDRVHRYADIDTLPKELNAFGIKLLELNKLFPFAKIIDTPSNHPYFLIRYLDDPDGRWLRDISENVKAASELFYTRINKIEVNPIKYWIQKYFPETSKFMVWPSEGDSIEITDRKIDMNVHGHLGPNGARGAGPGIKLAYQQVNQGHTHGPGIDGGLWKCGVMAHDHGYNTKSASNWLTANIAVYKNGQRQMQIIPRDSIEWRI